LEFFWRLLRRFTPRNDRKGRHCERILPFVIASLITIRRSNLLISLNTKRNVQRGDCFTPTHLPTLRFAMTDCCKRLLRRFAPRNDGKKGTRNDGKKGTRNDEMEKTAMTKSLSFCCKNNLYFEKFLRFSKACIS
jgi:hypothetical protein